MKQITHIFLEGEGPTLRGYFFTVSESEMVQSDSLMD